ncbi:MAG: iron export ABC transporter permease subunit FetB [Peptococcaceae bacterium]|nr:iron export ABC transporter permease subunit FetB [Peptococcaceae bacterium]
MSFTSLMLSLVLVLIAVVVSAQQKLALEKDIVIGTIRAVIQLLVVGYVLKFVFHISDWRLTVTMLVVMILAASQNASKRGQGMPGAFLVVCMAIGGSALATIAVMVILGVISFVPAQVIPIGGMVIGNAMVGAGLVLNRLNAEIRTRRLEVEAALALGATSRQAVEDVLRFSVKAGLIPTIDSLKTLGLVQLPGMMTGLILAGADPLQAVRYQMLVAFMLSSTVTLSCVIVGLLAYRRFFNKEHQLIDIS